MDDYHEMNCLNCGDWLGVIPTAYGERATCRRCKIRWTRIKEDRANESTRVPWVQEKYNPMQPYD